MSNNQRQVSTTSYDMCFLMVSSIDHLTGLTGLAPTVTLSKSGAAFGAAAGAVSEISSGWYKLAGNATDRNTLGELLLHATAAGADPVDERFEIITQDPFAANFGITTIATVTDVTNGVTLADDAITLSKFDETTAWPLVASDTIGTCTTNTDMRGTNSAATAAKLLAYVQLLARSDAAIETDNATELTAINADGGSGAGNFSAQTEALEAVRDRGDSAWITAVGFSVHTAADVWAVAVRVLTAGTNIVLAKGVGLTGLNDLSALQVNAECDTALTDYDPPTEAEMNLRTLLAAQYGTATNQTNIEADTVDIQGRLPAALVGGRMNSNVSNIDAPSANTIADHTLRRTFANAWTSADGDAATFRSLVGAVAKLVNRIRSNAGTLTIYEDDDLSVVGTQTVTTNAAALPVVELDT